MRPVFFALLAFLAFVPGAAALEPPVALSQATLYHVEVRGMDCPFCAYGVERRLNGIRGVQYVEVNLDAGRVAVAVGKGTVLSRARLRVLVENAGFKLAGLKEVPLTRANLANR